MIAAAPDDPDDQVDDQVERIDRILETIAQKIGPLVDPQLSPGWGMVFEALANAHHGGVISSQCVGASWAILTVIMVAEDDLPAPVLVYYKGDAIMVWGTERHMFRVCAHPSGTVDYAYHDFLTGSHFGPVGTGTLGPDRVHELSRLLRLAAGLPARPRQHHRQERGS